MTTDIPDQEPPSSAPRRLLARVAHLDIWLVLGVLGGIGVLAMRSNRYASLAWVPFLLAGLLIAVRGFVGPDADDEQAGYESEFSAAEHRRYLVSVIGWSLTPWGILTQLLQLVGQLTAAIRYGRSYPSVDRHVPETRPSLPFDGEWTVVNGGVTEETSHSWDIVSQRYAYDVLVTDENGQTQVDDGTELEDYYAYGEPVRAPAAGTVVATKDGLRDHPRPGTGWLEWRTWDIRGNHVVIEHADGECSTLAHLQAGSVAVSPGDRVDRGDEVGACGNSGHSSEPHLHYQLQDRASFWRAAGLVPRFESVAVSRDDERRGAHPFYESLDGDVSHLWAGDRVRPREE